MGREIFLTYLNGREVRRVCPKNQQICQKIESAAINEKTDTDKEASSECICVFQRLE
jgi:hypothetical protein